MFEYLFSFHGRSGRLSYFMFGIFWLFLIIIFGMASIFMGLLSPALMFTGLIGLVLAMYVSSFAITVRRLHDLDLTGWVFPFMMILLFISAVIKALMEHNVEMGHTYLLSAWALDIFVSVFYVMLLVWPGTDEGNRFN